MPTLVPPCPCGRDRRPAVAPAIERSAGAVSVRLEGVGAWVCDDGHAEVADQRLAARLLDAVDAQLLAARNRPLRHDDACGHCGAVLALPGRTTETPVVDDTGPTVVTLTPSLPMVRCPSCGREQVPATAARTLADLVTAVVDDRLAADRA